MEEEERRRRGEAEHERRRKRGSGREEEVEEEVRRRRGGGSEQEEEEEIQVRRMKRRRRKKRGEERRQKGGRGEEKDEEVKASPPWTGPLSQIFHPAQLQHCPVAGGQDGRVGTGRGLLRSGTDAAHPSRSGTRTDPQRPQHVTLRRHVFSAINHFLSHDNPPLPAPPNFLPKSPPHPSKVIKVIHQKFEGRGVTHLHFFLWLATAPCRMCM